ncbi:alpha/beta hydrolase [Nannocystaceae bacterium ST9]
MTYRTNSVRALLSTLLCVLGACATGSLEDPIPTATYPKSTSEPARALVIMLPGAGDRVGVYDERGFVGALRESGMDVDMLEVDAHYGYYKSRTLMERMGSDVLAPNRDRYDQIWIVGISMGGIGALLTAWTYPEDIDGLVLIAPYLGRRKTLEQISRAGGLAKWQPPAEQGEWDLEIWRMLKQVSEGESDTPQIWLMYGVDDFGVRAHELLAAGLPAERVETTSGGHAWDTWTRLWATLMVARPFVVEDARTRDSAASEAAASASP